jgi:hypothetical protein
MAKRYARINWQNKPSVSTPISAANLNKMDKGIDDCDNAIEDIYGKLFDKDNIIHNDTTNDTTKVPSAAVVYQHGQEIDALSQSVTTINNNLAKKPFTATVQLDKSTDYDTVTSAGVYFYNSWAGNAELGNNQPETNGILGTMLVFVYGASLDQMMLSPTKIMVRHYGGGSWSAWGSITLT